jgi:hypothetical protein
MSCEAFVTTAGLHPVTPLLLKYIDPSLQQHVSQNPPQCTIKVLGHTYQKTAIVVCFQSLPNLMKLLTLRLLHDDILRPNITFLCSAPVQNPRNRHPQNLSHKLHRRHLRRRRKPFRARIRMWNLRDHVPTILHLQTIRFVVVPLADFGEGETFFCTCGATGGVLECGDVERDAAGGELGGGVPEPAAGGVGE